MNIRFPQPSSTEKMSFILGTLRQFYFILSMELLGHMCAWSHLQSEACVTQENLSNLARSTYPKMVGHSISLLFKRLEEFVLALI